MTTVTPPSQPVEERLDEGTTNGFRMTSRYVAEVVKGETSGHKWRADRWFCRITYQGRTMDLDYNMGTGHRTEQPRYSGTWRPQAPKLADVLNSCFLDAELVEEYGNDPDEWQANLGGESIKELLATIAACHEETAKLRTLFGADYGVMRDRFREQ